MRPNHCGLGTGTPNQRQKLLGGAPLVIGHVSVVVGRNDPPGIEISEDGALRALENGPVADFRHIYRMNPLARNQKEFDTVNELSIPLRPRPSQR